MSLANASQNPEIEVDENPEFITPPNHLKTKLGGRSLNFDAAAIARAESALAGMSTQFADWLDDEIAKIEAAHKVILAPGAGEKEMEAFYRHAHDLKGLGSTYGYPIVSQFAASLTKLIDSPEARVRAPKQLLSAHVDSIIAAVRQKIKDTNHPVGNALLTELTRQVAKYDAGS